MSPMPQVTPGVTFRLTKNRPPPRTGVGQKSSDAELTGAPRFSGGPQGSRVLARCATQMSRSPGSPPGIRGRLEAMYRLSPSGDCIGQPSWYCVLSWSLVPGTVSALMAGLQGPKPAAWAEG